jgi:DNA-binding response OmpR family regulator
MHILLIEPDTLQANVYKAALEKQDHTVAHVATAQSAVQSADKRNPDAIVLELQLPSHNGVEFLYEFRSYPEWMHVPVIVHTFVPLYELTHTAVLQRELGVCKLLYKPTTSLASLCTAVKTATSITP